MSDIPQDPLYPEDDPQADDPATPEPDTHRRPTREIERVEADIMGETQVSATVPPDLPGADAAGPMTTLADLLDTPPDPDAIGETVVNPSIPTVPPLPRDQVPSRTYRDTTPAYSSRQQVPPPIYGGFEDREQRQRKRRGRTARERRDSGLYLPWWTLLLLLAGVAMVAALILLGFNALGGQFAPGGQTPVVIVVTSTFTPLPQPTERPTVAPLITAPPSPALAITGAGITVQPPTEEPSGPSLITPAPEVFEVGLGKTVEIFDVGEAGLNVREGPGTGFAVLFLAPEGGRYTVVDGPVPAGEFTWWRLSDAVSGQTGWAAENFLRVPAQ